jgi:biuret amidohydrolase
VLPVTGLDAEGDLLLPRYHGLSPMTGTPLDSLLRNAGVTTVVVAGVSLNVAIPNLVFDAVNRAYQVIVVTDAVAGTPLEYGESVLRHSLSLLATLATTDEVVAVWEASVA